MKDKKITEKKVIKEFFNYSDSKAIIPNIKFFMDYESDIIQIKNNSIYEYEIKLSNADFINDFTKKKIKHRMYHNGITGCPDYFLFIIPKGMVSKELIPDKYGLYEFEIIETVYKNYTNIILKFSCTKYPKKISRENALNSKIYEKFIRSLSWKLIGKTR